MTKPEKIYLDNTNLMAALAHSQQVDRGSLRETFFYSAVLPVSQVSAANPGDFLLDKRYTFEIGGKAKTTDQIKSKKDAYLAIDSVEIGSGKKIPLWLFGFLY